MQPNLVHNVNFTISQSVLSNNLQLNWSMYVKKTSNLNLEVSSDGEISHSFLTFSICELHPAKQKGLKLN